MNSLKTKIIYQYIITTVALFVCEGWLAYFLFKYLPQISNTLGIDEMFIECAGVFLGLVILFAVSYYFYRKVSKCVSEESKKQVKQRNIIFANISHDLKNPMSSVLGFARALEEDNVSAAEKKAVYRLICDKSTQMNNMILKMFRYAKIESDGYFLSLKKEELGAVLRNIIADRYSEIEKHKIELDIGIPDKAVEAMIDSTEFSRVINNLITNAVRHNDIGIGLLVSLKKTKNEITVSIADTGTEISKNSYESIFEPFQCSDESRQKKDGSGLGLAIARRIVELHNGKLYIDDSVKGYTKAFVIKLQLRI